MHISWCPSRCPRRCPFEKVGIQPPCPSGPVAIPFQFPVFKPEQHMIQMPYHPKCPCPQSGMHGPGKDWGGHWGGY